MSTTEQSALVVALHTHGCRVNAADASMLADALRKAGAFPVHAWAEPDLAREAGVHVLTTCAVTMPAAAEARKFVRALLRKTDDLPIVAIGCYARVDQEALDELGDRVHVITEPQPDDVARQVIALGQRYGGAGAVIRQSASAGQRRVRPPVKIQDGCNRRCAYCIVPYARGPSRSVPLEQVEAQVRDLARCEAAEIVLVGVNLGCYGRDLSPRVSLVDLVDRLAAIEGGPRVRLSSIEPDTLDDALISRIADGRLCESVHLPLQSGDDRVLKAMGRPYRVGMIRDLVGRLSAEVPGITIGADLIAGFPGEDAQAHEASVSLVTDHNLSTLHVFRYSLREGTRAATMPQLPSKIARSRAAELREVGEGKMMHHLRGMVGSRFEVVVETVNDGVARGRTRNYLIARFNAEDASPGQIRRVIAVEAEEHMLLGELVTL